MQAQNNYHLPTLVRGNELGDKARCLVALDIANGQNPEVAKQNALCMSMKSIVLSNRHVVHV